MALPINYSVRSLALRWKSTLLAMIGIALVVAVFVAVLSMASGFRRALRSSGHPGNAIVLQKGALSELGSSFSKAAGDWVSDDSRVAHTAGGTAWASPELAGVVALPGRPDAQLMNVGIRGVTAMAFAVRPEVVLVAGRRPRAGLFEIIVGRQTSARIRGLEIGSRISLLRQPFEVVGVFSADGSALESEVWGDLDAMSSVFNRAGSESSLTVRLEDAKVLPAFDRELRANLQFPLTMTDEQKYYEEQAGPLLGFLRSLAIFVGVVMGIGAVFAAMNTMYALVAARTREVGTLRALGFSRSAVLITFVFEGLVVAAVGGVAGCMLSLSMSGARASTAAGLGELSFAFRTAPADVGCGLLFAAAMGMIGSVLPAARAARLPIVSALRKA